MHSRSRRRGLSLGTLVLVVILFFLSRSSIRDLFRPAPEPSGEWYTVVRVIDGDTIVVAPNPSPAFSEGSHIRLIGVDTPEDHHPSKPVEYFGYQAAAFTRRLCEGRRVRLEFDPAAGHDPYGRTLAYVYLDDGSFLNAEIIRQGYGHALTRFPFRYLEDFRALERDARDHRRGLWAGE